MPDVGRHPDDPKIVFDYTGPQSELPSRLSIAQGPETASFVITTRAAPLRDTCFAPVLAVTFKGGDESRIFLPAAQAVEMAMAVLRAATPSQGTNDQALADAPPVSAETANKMTAAENWTEAAADQSRGALWNIAQVAAREIGAPRLCGLLRQGVTAESKRRLHRIGCGSNIAALLGSMSEDRVHAVYLLVHARVMQHRADLLADEG